MKNVTENWTDEEREWLDAWSIDDAPNHIRSSKKFLLKYLEDHGDALEYVLDDLRNDQDVVLTAVRNDGWALEYASEELKSDKDIVVGAVKNNGLALEYASDTLKNDIKVVTIAIKNDARALQYASAALRSNEAMVLIAIKENGSTLEYAADNLKNNKGIVLIAVRNEGWALKYASNEMKNDKEVVLSALKTDPEALNYASGGLKEDKEIVLKAISGNARAFIYASEELKMDKEIIDTVVNAIVVNENNMEFFVKSSLQVTLGELFRDIGIDLNTLIVNSSSYMDIFILYDIIKNENNKLQEYLDNIDDDKWYDYRDKFMGLLENSRIENLWKYELIGNQIFQGEISVNWKKYINGWQDAIDKLKGHLESIDISNTSENEISKLVDYAMGLFHLSLHAATENGPEGVTEWIMQLGNPSIYYGYGNDAFWILSENTQGASLDSLVDYLEKCYLINLESEEFYDDMEGVLWDSVAEEVISQIC